MMTPRGRRPRSRASRCRTSRTTASGSSSCASASSNGRMPGGKQLLEVPGYKFQALRTNLPPSVSALEVWRRYNGRADLENRIKALGRPVRLEGPVLPLVLGDRGRLPPRHLRLQLVRRVAAPARSAATRRTHHAALAAVFLRRGLPSRGWQTHAQARRRHAPTPRLVARSPPPIEGRRRLRGSCRPLRQSRSSPTHPALNCMSPAEPDSCN